MQLATRKTIPVRDAEQESKMQNLNTSVDHYKNEVIDSISQKQHQFENLSITLIKITDPDNNANLPVGSIVMHEDLCSDSNYYLLDATESTEALSDTSKYLADCANDWASNTDDYNGERVRWGIIEPSELVVSDDYNGECKIMIVGSYYGCSPVSYAQDNSGEDIVFDNPAAARKWIAEASSDTYYLSHNEAGRPDYYIVEY
jgi:hypothetical protein